ncbi:DUF397 domain-containing protein [Streptomyces sp. NEAU-sy36]|uniref:DUF397 domain-containing protein n=1 Tax=unclassified Streptomyces TaxID=2593676 RepID=UPI0015D63380|nr:MULTISPECIES: DUF397 domain-containing protein [unclassified Streptomyces]QLJ00187.1 DUF397 domain-containing protein [Streptomyces sp. NEAU-sy36]
MSAGPQPAPEPRWFKSSYSGGNATECVEAAFVPSGVLVRDSKNVSGPILVLHGGAWQAFSEAVGNGQLGN